MARSRDDVIRVVQGLWAKADDPAATPEEREAFVTKARDLMAEHVIDEMVLNEASADKEAVILSDIKIIDDTNNTMDVVADQRILLAHFIGVNNRCRCVIQRRGPSVAEDGSPITGGTYLTVVGFRSDVETVRSMYAVVGLDMLTAMFMEPTSHMTNNQRANYFANFCDGYACRIDDRLKQITTRITEMATSDGSLLPVLQSREVAVRDVFDDMFPNLKSQKVSRFTYDQSAQQRGSAAAESADLGQKKVGGERKGIGR